MGKDKSEGPYTSLGRQLRALRAKANESLAETSGAVEIEVQELAKIELGGTRPSEEVLLLLISHFEAGDEEAVKLWEMAGYDSEDKTSNHPVSASTAPGGSQPIMFTDIVDVIVNNYGVVMNFMQSSGQKNGPSIVARVGMSREHAKSVMQILKTTLAQTELNSQAQQAVDETSEPKNG